MARTRPTIHDLRAMKGKRQLTMLRVMNLEEAEAAEQAGIDIVSIPPELLLNPQYRDAAPSLFSMPGENFFEIGTGDDLTTTDTTSATGIVRRFRDGEEVHLSYGTYHACPAIERVQLTCTSTCYHPHHVRLRPSIRPGKHQNQET